MGKTNENFRTIMGHVKAIHKVETLCLTSIFGTDDPAYAVGWLNDVVRRSAELGDVYTCTYAHVASHCVTEIASRIQRSGLAGYRGESDWPALYADVVARLSNDAAAHDAKEDAAGPTVNVKANTTVN